jgi:hypothetical protein
MSDTIEAGATLEMFQKESRDFTFTITNDDGTSRNLTGKTLRFVVHDSNDPPSYKAKVEEAGMDVTGKASGVIVVTVGSPASDDATTEWHYELWNTTDSEVLQHGPFRVKPAVIDAP